MEDQVKFLRVSIFYLDQEYVLIQKSYQNQNSQQTKRDFSQDLRQCLRNRTALIKKLQSSKTYQVHDVKDGSHLVIQVNHLIFLDLAGIENLNKSQNPLLINSLTMNFSSITNEILKLSQFYSNHQFAISEEQDSTAFNQYLKHYISKQSKIILLCCVSTTKESIAQTSVALDYCQKIKCYFNGVSEEDLQTILTIKEDTWRQQNQFFKETIEVTQISIEVDQVSKKI